METSGLTVGRLLKPGKKPGDFLMSFIKLIQLFNIMQTYAVDSIIFIILCEITCSPYVLVGTVWSNGYLHQTKQMTFYVNL